MNGKEKRFNQFAFHKAYDFMKSDPLEACRKFQEYISLYPYDYSAYPHYIKALIKIKKLDEAKKLCNYVEGALNENQNIVKDSHIYQVISLKLLNCKVRILAYQGKYDELFSLCNNHMKELENYNGKTISFYCRVKLGLLPSYFMKPRNYLFSQMFEYSEQRFLENVQKNFASNTSDNPNYFNDYFPFKELYPTIKNSLHEENRLYLGLFDDFYIFQYDGCGKCEKKDTDYFVVVCFHDTKNIITIKPFDNGRYLPHVNLNIKEEDKAKTKTLSQIDKFYMRYRKNSQ